MTSIRSFDVNFITKKSKKKKKYKLFLNFIHYLFILFLIGYDIYSKFRR